MSTSSLTPAQHSAAVDLAAALIEAVPDETPTDVAAIAALTLVRYVAMHDPSLAPRIAAVLSHTSHELVTGQLFTAPTH